MEQSEILLNLAKLRCIIDIILLDDCDVILRTTITIEDDLAMQIEDLRKREGLSFKEALNQLLRAGVQYQAQPPKPHRYRTPTRKLGLNAGIDATKLSQLADECVQQWLAQPNTTIVVPTPRHWPLLETLLLATDVGANLTTDAHIAALALEHGFTVYSNNSDFGRFVSIPDEFCHPFHSKVATHSTANLPPIPG